MTEDGSFSTAADLSIGDLTQNEVTEERHGDLDDSMLDYTEESRLVVVESPQLEDQQHQQEHHTEDAQLPEEPPAPS